MFKPKLFFVIFLNFYCSGIENIWKKKLEFKKKGNFIFIDVREPI